MTALRLAAAVALALVSASCVGRGVPEVSSARISYGGGETAVVYLVAEGGADRLVDVEVDGIIGHFHETVLDEDGRMTMRPHAGPLTVTPPSPLVFEPGGLHIMLTGLDPGLWTPGDRVEVILVWEEAGSRRLLVPVVDPASALGGGDG